MSLVFSSLAITIPASAQTPTPTDLGVLPGSNANSNSQANAISADGSTVVGYGDDSLANSTAFRWTQAGGMVNMGFFAGENPANGAESYAQGVSGDGSVIVGYGYLTSAGAYTAFRWTQAGGMQSMGYLSGGGTNSRASAVSADGTTIVGFSNSTNYNRQAFRWTQATGMVGLGALANNRSEATAVNADGTVVVGASGSTSQAFRWVLTNAQIGAGTMTGLGFMTDGNTTGNFSYATGVNADGSVVVGYANIVGGGLSQAFRWTAGTGTMTGLGFLTGGTTSRATGVNADGSVVVGSGTSTATNNNNQAFRWTSATGMVGLGILSSGTFSQASSVSADGSVVVGFGDIANGAYHALTWRILTPATSSSASGATTTTLAPATSSSKTIVTKPIDLTNTYAAMGGTIQNAGSFTASRGAQMAGLGGGGVAGGACFDCFSSASASTPATGSASFYGDLPKSLSSNNPLATMQALAPDADNTNAGTKSASISQLTGSGASNSYLSFGARYLNSGKFVEGAGTLRGGYRLTDSIIAHAFIDYAGNIRAPAYYKPKDASPTLGGGLSWYQNTSGLGAQASVFGAWQHERVKITRVALANTEAGTGTANVSSKMFGGELGYGFAALKDVTATPYVGLRYVSINRGAYSEAFDMNTTFPISYNAMGQRQVTATFGTRASWAVMPNLKLHATLGGEYDVVQKLAALSGTSLIPGLTSFSATATGPKNRLRPVAGFGMTYQIAKNQFISADTFAQTQIYTNAIAFGASVAYRVGF